MKARWWWLLPLCLLWTEVLPARQVALDFHKGNNSIIGWRLAFRPAEMPLKKLPLVGDVRLYVELAGNFWLDDHSHSRESAFALSISPVIFKEFAQVGGRPLYWELGVGLALVDTKHFADRDISSHYHFEDRIGLIWPLDDDERHSLTLRYLHYSNAGLSTPNQGLDFIGLSYAYRF